MWVKFQHSVLKVMVKSGLEEIFLKMMHFTLIFDRMMVAMMSIFYSLNIKENAMQSHKLLTRRFYFGINFVSNKLILYCAQRCDLIRSSLVTEMTKLKFWSQQPGQNCQSSPFATKNGPNWLNQHCCFAGSSKTAPKI